MSKHTNPAEVIQRHDQSDDLLAQLDTLTKDQRQSAYAWLWGTMTMRDPEACRDAINYALTPWGER